MAESAGERTEQATPKRRAEARRQGTVAKSQDLVGALGGLVLLMVLPAAGASIGRGAVTAVHAGYSRLPINPSFNDLAGQAMRTASSMVGGLFVLLFAVMAVGVIANVAQIGFKMSPEALTPSLAKLNPIAGVQRLLSKAGAVETGKGTFKTVVFGLLACSVLRSAWPQLMTLGGADLGASFEVVTGILKMVAMRIVPAWLALAALDYFFQHKRVNDQLKMTKEEVKQEMKDQQMSPEVMKERAKRARKLSQGSMMKAIKTADVVVTNPTHFAVAIKYEHGKNAAPVIVAKGVDFLAAKIREEAKAHRVPLVPNPPLARALYKQCEIGDPVPHELFKAVAEVLAYVYRTLRRVQA